MSLYTINNLRKQVLQVDDNYQLLLSIPNKKEEIYLVFGVDKNKQDDFIYIKVIWINNMLSIDTKENLDIVKQVPAMVPTAIDQEQHVFQILKLHHEISTEEIQKAFKFSYMGKM